MVHSTNETDSLSSAQVWDSDGGASFQFLASSKDGAAPLVFTGGADGTVKLFDLRVPSGSAAAKLKAHDGPLVRFC